MSQKNKIVQTGEVSMERWSGEMQQESIRILLLGATGSGKSSFIEALAGKDHRLGITGSTLASVTQDVQAFKVVNMHLLWYKSVQPLFIVDTPGFLDSKMSELQIVKRVNQWIRTSGKISYVFYFCRITDTRLPGSARRLMRIIKSIGVKHESLAIVTSMWDTIWRAEALKRAEDHFLHLEDVIWKVAWFWYRYLTFLMSLLGQDDIKNGAAIVKFWNTQSSAIEILAGVREWVYSYDFAFLLYGNTNSLVYSELLDRIQNAHQERQANLDDRIRLLTSCDPDLEVILIASLRDVDDRLANYNHQLIMFGTPPKGFESFAIQSLLNITLGTQTFLRAIESTLTQLPSLPANEPRRTELSAILHDAKDEFQRDYFALRDLGSPPSVFHGGPSSVFPHLSDRIKWEALYTRHCLQRFLKQPSFFSLLYLPNTVVGFICQWILIGFIFRFMFYFFIRYVLWLFNCFVYLAAVPRGLFRLVGCL
ncbi:hypothetical protein CVT24_009755 [Panaeolus cyanescens]|uniref:G domain-containing protein n=1 Tax=Panaeolus cyanescens TaxID=181874 RepID=A0A409WU49_9AGAR|nr:hypothetical protein CVT24_009755 [Panaeolus cyanescens]